MLEAQVHMLTNSETENEITAEHSEREREHTNQVKNVSSNKFAQDTEKHSFCYRHVLCRT